MEDKHLDTIPEPKSDELIKSSIEDLAHTPSESDGISKSKYDLPVCDDSSPKKDEVLDDIISIPLGNGNDHFNAESSLIESVLNRNNVISSPMIEFLLKEFAGELALIAPIPPGIDNSFPRPLETLKDDFETVIDSNNDYSSSDNDSLYSDDYRFLLWHTPPDSELVLLRGGWEIVIQKLECCSGSPTSYLDLSLLDYEAFFYDSKPDSGNITMDVVEDIFDNPIREPRVHVPNVFPPSHLQLIRISLFLVISIGFRPLFDTLLLFSSKNEDNVFNPGILASNEEKSPHLLSHQSFKASKLFHHKIPMLIHGDNIPILDVPFLHFYPP
ncbi:hypothetical protein Tco_0636715 [Tanacetum coccineum]